MIGDAKARWSEATKARRDYKSMAITKDPARTSEICQPASQPAARRASHLLSTCSPLQLLCGVKPMKLCAFVAPNEPGKPQGCYTGLSRRNVL